jgi:hypothetical protein
MSISALPASGAQSPAAGLGLIQKANGEYTAASVAANPVLSYGMVRQLDGGYAYPVSTAARTTLQVQMALYSLKTGG